MEYLNATQVETGKVAKKNVFQKVPFPYWVITTLIIGFLLGTLFPGNPFIHGIAISGTYFPKTIVTFATPIIFFLLAGATSRLLLVHKDKAGRLFGRIFLLYLVIGLASLIWVSLFIKFVVGLGFTSNGTPLTFSSFIISVFGTFKTIITQQPLLQVLVAAVIIGWICAVKQNLKAIANGIIKISDYILKVFKWLLWYYPIMIGCLAINIPLKFGTKGIAYYGQTVWWIAIASISWAIVLVLLTKVLSKRSWKQIMTYFWTVYPTGFGTGGSYDTLAVNIVSAEKDLELKPEIAEVSIVFGTVLNKSTATMAVMLVTISVCTMLHIPFSFFEILLLVLPLWILGLESPGVPGGAGFFMSPVIAVIFHVPDPALFITTFITMYSGLVPMLTTAVNTTGDGFMGAILQDRLAREKEA